MHYGALRPLCRLLLRQEPSASHARHISTPLCHSSSSTAASLQSSNGEGLRRVEFSQDRIGRDGSLIAGTLPGKQEHASQQQGQPRPATLPGTAPVLPPIAEAQLQQLVDLIAGSRQLVVLTGAGCSTESSVPDYRGPQGAYSTGFKPITHQQFMASQQAQKRYWARSFAGWHEFSDIHPNAAHEGLARLQQRGWVDALITQNVDRLHQKAGATDVIELHGTTHRVICMGCGDTSPRQPFQDLLADLNPGAADHVKRLVAAGHDAEAARQRSLRVGASEQEMRQAQLFKRRPDGDVEVPVRRPDGDVELQDAGKGFIVPPCPNCGGILKPDVVFFGDGVPPARSKRVLELAQDCDTMLVVGSSLMVYSAFRLSKAAKAGDGRLAILSAGPTRADDMADLKVEALAGEALARIAAHPALLLPKLAA